MPYLDGWGFMNEFNKIISVLKKKVLVYIVSASSSKSDFDRAFNLNGVAGYLVKPFDKGDFGKLIEAYPNSLHNSSVQ
jgi:response regulator of citrate/malate metabolism